MINSIKNIFAILLLLTFVSCNRETEFYSNGNLKMEVPTKNGLRDGMFKAYYENGRIKEQRPYKLGKIEGEAIIYDSVGNIIDRVNFVNNQYNGPFYKYYENGKIRWEGNSKNGKPDGVSYHYYQNGKVEKVYFHKEGELLYHKAYDENGKFYQGKLPISIVPKGKKDFYPLNEEHEITITLAYTHLKNTSIGVVFGPLDKENHVINTISKARSEDLSLNYKVKPSQTGINEVTGELYELQMPSDSVVGSYFFRYSFNVKN